MSRFRPILAGVFVGLGAAGLLLAVARRPSGQAVELRLPPEPREVRVHVAGAVASPGVYQLAPGSIVQDAVNAAGGVRGDADLNGLNLAAILADGALVWVPSTLAPDSRPTIAPGNPGGLVNLNTATLEELDQLPGLGPVISQSIIDYRKANGPFQFVDDLLEVPGIGEATLETLRPLVTVGTP